MESSLDHRNSSMGGIFSRIQTSLPNTLNLLTSKIRNRHLLENELRGGKASNEDFTPTHFSHALSEHHHLVEGLS
jgi:hypothetical protein